jgi:hypothetical protein
MALEVPYTKLRNPQFRGPSTSDDYNARMEENYKDLVVLYNKIRLLDEDLAEFYRRLVKDQVGLARALSDLEARVTTLEDDATKLTFRSDSQVDTNRFNATIYNVAGANRLTLDSNFGVITLPRVDVSSLSKLFFTNSEGVDILPPTLEVRVVPDPTSADSSGATIDTSDPTLAVIKKPGRIWERNVIVNSSDPDGAIITYYLKVPTDLFTTDKSNIVVLQPYPAFSTDIMEVMYTSVAEPVMTDNDGYTALNDIGLWSGTADAVGWAPPGGWVGDPILDAGAKGFYFDPKVITGLRIKLRTRHYNVEATKYVYSYGMTVLDLRYDKFMSTGKIMLKFDAPSGNTISQITNVEPQIWNVAGAEYPNIFSYRVIWETAPNSGSYTLTPVSNSQKVWLEITLNETVGKGSPALSGVTVSYT